MTNRAKRLAWYLEEQLGWTVFEDITICKGCGKSVYGSKFCPDCGTKQGKPNRKVVLDEIESAIEYALKEST